MGRMGEGEACGEEEGIDAGKGMGGMMTFAWQAAQTTSNRNEGPCKKTWATRLKPPPILPKQAPMGLDVSPPIQRDAVSSLVIVGRWQSHTPSCSQSPHQ